MLICRSYKTANLLFAACLALASCSGCGGNESPESRYAEGPAEGVRLAGIFSDRMVLQHGTTVPVWGWADGGSEVTVTIAGQRQAARVVPETGKWTVRLDPLEPGGPHTLRVTGQNEINCHNVLVGEVWLCSGQSNMEWPVKLAKDAEQEIAAANYPDIRLLTVPKEGSETVKRDFDGEWVECNPASVAGFSSVAYFFGRGLHQQLDMPIGLIDSTRGGSTCEAWMSRRALEADPQFRRMLEDWDQHAETYDAEAARSEYQMQLTHWNEAVFRARSQGAPLPRKPTPPSDPRTSELRPANLHNAMIAPLVPYAIRGVIWYQGESNRFRAYQYRSLFPELITSWRKEWNQGTFPFFYVQVANVGDVRSEPAESEWAELRDAQSMALTLENTGQAVAIDLGEAHNIHPPNKQEVGRRLSLWALARVYGKVIVCSGPVFRSMSIRGDAIVVEFDHTADGLIARGSGELQGFAVAGADRRFVWADARIEGDTVVVSSPQVAEPVAVRYAWADNPVCNLYNSAGLPASPFRTDDWPGLTADSR